MKREKPPSIEERSLKKRRKKALSAGSSPPKIRLKSEGEGENMAPLKKSSDEVLEKNWRAGVERKDGEGFQIRRREGNERGGEKKGDAHLGT